MPVYNVAEYVGAAVGSVLGQTFKDFELIVVDDGSTDGTLRVLSEFEADSRIKVFAEVHRGAPFPLQRGIELASGRYIAFLDGDDLWAPTKLDRHIELFDNHPEADLTFSWSRILNEDGSDTGLTSQPWRGPVSFAQLLVDNVIGNGSALVVRRGALEATGGMETSLPCCYDLDCWLRVALLRPGNLRAIPEFLTFYRRRPGQLTRKVDVMEKSFERVIQRVGKLAPDVVRDLEKKARCNMQRFFAFGCYQNGDYSGALKFLKCSFTAAPIGFLADIRNLKMTAAVLAGLTLPERWHASLIRAMLRSARVKSSEATALMR